MSTNTKLFQVGATRHGGMTCTVDGVSFDCEDAFRLLDLGQAAVCPRNNCTGATFNANGLYLLTYHEPTYSNTTECSPDPNDPDADWQCSGKISLTMGGWSSDYVGGNSSWWSTFRSTFVNGVLHGVRQPGQSFAACFEKNVSQTTFGLIAENLAGAAATVGTAAVGVATTVKDVASPLNPSVRIPLSSLIGVVGALGARAFSGGVISQAAAARIAVATPYALAVSGGAALGLTIGSGGWPG